MTSLRSQLLALACLLAAPALARAQEFTPDPQEVDEDETEAEAAGSSADEPPRLRVPRPRERVVLDLPFVGPPAELEPEPGEHRTFRAGEGLETEVFGEQVVVDPRDRETVTALNLGAAFYAPSVAETSGVPILALYSKGNYYQRRYRLVASGLVNEFDFAEDFGGLESLFHFENQTIPFERTWIFDNTSNEATSELWGRVSAWLGVGYRWKVQPGYDDNDLRVGVFYSLGYQYHQPGDETPDFVTLPSDTFIHGIRLRARLDSLQRNLFELPHFGYAIGFDFEFTRRDRWTDASVPGVFDLDANTTRDYLKTSGYLIVASGLPGLSERHRLISQLHVAWSPGDDLDRYSAFQLLGGPIPSESSDLARPPFPGASFDEYPLQDYLVVNLEYRFELLLFLFAHLRASWGQARRPTTEGSPDGSIRFRRGEDVSLGGAITTGFLFESQLYVEADYTFTGELRGGQEGTSLLFLWSKAF